MNERVILMEHNGGARYFYLESAQDRDYLTIAERPQCTVMNMSCDVRLVSEVRKRTFRFDHFGPMDVPVYYEMERRIP